MPAPRLLAIALLAALASRGIAQEPTPQPMAAPRTKIERHLADLAVPEKRHNAMLALWAAGAPAVPLLGAAISRGDDTSAPALRVLFQLGGEAAPAAPVLRRVQKKAKEPFRSELGLTLARVEGPACILVSRHEAGEIAQVDFAGNVMRRVTCKNPWGVWPLPDDKLGVICFEDGAVLQMDWAGAVLQTETIVTCLTSFTELADGDRITTNWGGNGLLARRGPDGEMRWTQQNDAFRATRLLDELIVVTRKPARLVAYSLAGAELRSVDLPTPCCGVWPLPSGNTMVSAHNGRVLEVDPTGRIASELNVGDYAQDVARLRDGRTIVASKKGLFLFAQDGTQIWHLADLGECGPMFVRAPW